MARKLKRTDLSLMRAMRKTEGELMTLIMRLFTKMGDPLGWTLLSIGIMIYDRTLTGFGLKLGLVSLVGALLAKGIKRLFRRQRPCLHQSFPKALTRIPDPWSFPSGHTTSAFAVAAFCLAVCNPAVSLFMGLAVCIALSRVYLGVHFPSDVFAGMCLGLIAGISSVPFMNLIG